MRAERPSDKANVLGALSRGEEGAMDYENDDQSTAYYAVRDLVDAASDEFRKMTGVDVGSDPQPNSGNPQQAPKDSGRGK